MDERLWMVQDANFNVTAVVDDSGEVVERYFYDPFGQATVLDAEWNVRSGGSAYDWHYLHQGGRYDVTSGLYHFRFRDYSPTLGRWTSLDPLSYAAGDVNLYRTVGNDPINSLDPSGLDDDWKKKWEWHHMFPKEFRNEFPDFDFDAPENGYMIRGGPHRGEGDSLHSKKWNQRWREWIDKQKIHGIPITPESIREQAKKLKESEEFRRFFEDAYPASERYDVRQRRLEKEAQERAAREAQKRTAREAAEKTAQKAARKAEGGIVRRVGRRIPFVKIGVILFFWQQDVQAKGWVGGTVNGALDLAPIVGDVKGVVELFTGDLIPDQETGLIPDQEIELPLIEPRCDVAY